MSDFEDEAAIPPASDLFGAEGESLLTGTPAFEALFAAFEHGAPIGDGISLALLLGSNFAPFG